jgi:hypothetical protein
VELFITNNRHNNIRPGAQAVNQGRCQCTAERIRYFFRAHSYAYRDFCIVNRSRDDITFFAAMNVATMQTLVRDAFGELDADDIDEATQSDSVKFVNVDVNSNTYELGLIRESAKPRCPDSLHAVQSQPRHYWHKDLLTAIAELF